MRPQRQREALQRAASQPKLYVGDCEGSAEEEDDRRRVVRGTGADSIKPQFALEVRDSPSKGACEGRRRRMTKRTAIEPRCVPANREATSESTTVRDRERAWGSCAAALDISGSDNSKGAVKRSCEPRRSTASPTASSPRVTQRRCPTNGSREAGFRTWTNRITAVPRRIPAHRVVPKGSQGRSRAPPPDIAPDNREQRRSRPT